MALAPAASGLSPQEMFSRAIANLNAVAPSDAQDAMEQVGDWVGEFLKDALDAAIEGMGLRRGTPEERLKAYSVDKTDVMWEEQRKMFPRDFDEDARDAQKLGAPLPGWVTAYLVAQGAVEVPPEAFPGKRALLPAIGARPAAPGFGTAPTEPTMGRNPAEPTVGLPVQPRGFRTALVPA